MRLLDGAFRAAAEGAFDRNLSSEHAALAGLVEARPDGSIGVREASLDARYKRAYSGAYWQIGEGAAARYSRSMWDFQLSLPEAGKRGAVEWLYAVGPTGQSLRVVRQQITVPRASAPVTLMVAADMQPVADEVQDFRWLAASAVGVLSALFAASLAVQVHIGLRPLRQLSKAVTDIAEGREQQLDVDRLPGEVQPLAGHLNVLLSHHVRSLERARRAAADLAHGLKTPLAALDAAAQRPDGELATTVRSHVSRMQAVIERRLAGAITVDFRARTPIVGVAKALAEMFAAQLGRRSLRLSIDLDPAVCFPGSTEHLEEILGNLIDNACKWSKSQICVGGQATRNGLSFWVDDDGPGIEAAAAALALSRGVRLDEQMPGSGLGLAIVADLLAAHGGELQLSRSPLGGLRAQADLPALTSGGPPHAAKA